MAQEDIVIEKACQLLKEKYGAKEIYIFGSYINGHYQAEKSDLDMAVFLPQYKDISLKKLAEIVYEVQSSISAQIELHFFPEQKEPLSFSEYILKTGRKIA